MKYRKKPIIVEAIQCKEYFFNGIGSYDYNKIRRFIGSKVKLKRTSEGKLSISTSGRMFFVSPNDYIIKGIKGEFYPCKPDIFEQTYEPVKGEE